MVETASPKIDDQKDINILILDDERPLQRMLGRLLYSNGYAYSVASDTREARSVMEMQDIGLLLCDVNLPGESGMDFIKYVSIAYPDTAVIMVTGLDDPELAENALELGAYGYMIKPFRPNEMMINISNALRRRSLEIANRFNFDNLERIVDTRTSDLQKTIKKLEKIVEGLIHAISLTIEARDPYTAGHQSRVAELAVKISTEMELSAEQVEGIRMAALIHDLGKITAAAEIPGKPGSLKDLENDLMKNHPQAGYDILKDIDFPWPLASIVLQHHERLDGSGYPLGLSGKHAILLEAKILAVADVFEVIASQGTYRPSLGKGNALKEIQNGSGSLYDPTVVEACSKVISSGKLNSLFH